MHMLKELYYSTYMWIEGNGAQKRKKKGKYKKNLLLISYMIVSCYTVSTWLTSATRLVYVIVISSHTIHLHKNNNFAMNILHNDSID